MSACRRSPSAPDFLANRDFVAQSHAYMRRLMEQSGETANLAILDGTEAVFIAQVQCREMMRILVKLGSRVPLHASGVGKAIFAALPDEQIDAILKVKGLPRITETHDRRAGDDVGGAQRDPPARLLVRRRGACARHALRRGARSTTSTRSRWARSRSPARRRGCPTSASGSSGPIVAHIAEELTRKVGGRWPHPIEAASASSRDACSSRARRPAHRRGAARQFAVRRRASSPRAAASAAAGVVADQHHVAARGERRVGALDHVAGDGAPAIEVVAENQAVETEPAAQDFLQPHARIACRLGVDAG